MSTFISRQLAQKKELAAQKRSERNRAAFFRSAREIELRTAVRERNLLLTQNRSLKLDSQRDPLTNLLNRRGFEFEAHRIISGQIRHASHDRSPDPFAYIMLDVDHFKSVNDTFGHGVGDKALIAVAKQLQKVFHRDDDICLRYGGEEVGVLFQCPPNKLQEVIVQLGERLRTEIEKNCKLWKDGSIGPESTGADFARDITVSIGAASYQPSINDREGIVADIVGLMASADEAMYSAKQNGRNRMFVNIHGVHILGSSLTTMPNKPSPQILTGKRLTPG